MRSNKQATQLQVTSTFKAGVSGVYAAGQFIVRSRYMEVRAHLGCPYLKAVTESMYTNNHWLFHQKYVPCHRAQVARNQLSILETLPNCVACMTPVDHLWVVDVKFIPIQDPATTNIRELWTTTKVAWFNLSLRVL